MQVLSHRGYWKTPEEKNKRIAFTRSFDLGFGTETDLRDLAGTLVVSHDPPEDRQLTASEMAAIHDMINPSLTLALNVKADGLQEMTKALFEKHSMSDAFVFDMSIPDAIQWANAGIPFFTRQSDVEPEPNLYASAAGVWLDAFYSDWWTVDVISRHLDAGKRVCVVSPDLHKRDHKPAWNMLASSDVSRHSDVLICTDYPEAAKGCFVDAS